MSKQQNDRDQLEAGKRLSDEDFAKVFEQHSPLAMGFLLDTMSKALAILPAIRLDDSPRLMDFAKLGAAVGRVLDPEFGEQEFNTRYRDSRETASLQALDAMPVVQGLLDYLEAHAPYTGNYAQLLLEIERTTNKSSEAGWPKTGRGLSDAIGRAKPMLNLLGWSIKVAGRSKKGANVTIKKKAVSAKMNFLELPSTTNTTSTETKKGAGGAHGAGDIPQIYNHSKHRKKHTSELPHSTGSNNSADSYRLPKSGSRGGAL